MTALYVTLLAIAVPLLIAVPIILLVKAFNAWRDIPREIYASQQQRLFGLKASTYWVASVIFNQLARFLEWSGWKNSADIAQDASLALLSAVLVYHFFWAMRIVRFRVNLDARLVRFAYYALFGSAFYICALADSVVETVTAK